MKETHLEWGRTEINWPLDSFTLNVINQICIRATASHNKHTRDMVPGVLPFTGHSFHMQPPFSPISGPENQILASLPIALSQPT